MIKPVNWQCPYCNHDTVLDEKSISTQQHDFNHGNELGSLSLFTEVFCCPNPECRKMQVDISLYKSNFQQYGGYDLENVIFNWRLMPESTARPFPDYIPKPILDDYREACLIRDKSPKASATLSRRCLQGMIRDFFGIIKSRLKDEIDALQGQVSPVTWRAINAVREIGNIGAHMEKDINLIVDVEPAEADLLIKLIERLLKDWYINRAEQEKEMSDIVKIAGDKKTIRDQKKGAEGK